MAEVKKYEEPRIGVFVCHCGTNIAGSIDVKAVMEYARTLPNVIVADDYQYMCSTPGQNKIAEAIDEQKLTGIVVAACSPRLHEPTFRNATKMGGLNPFRFEMANIREQNSWVHMHQPEEATEKAKDAVRIAVAKAALLEDLIPNPVWIDTRIGWTPGFKNRFSYDICVLPFVEGFFTRGRPFHSRKTQPTREKLFSSHTERKGLMV
jgi:heterodisulfide reductase subunit A